MFTPFSAFLSHGIVALQWWQIVLVTLILTHVTIISVTVYLHRCQAHHALNLHPIASHFFRFWLWMTTGILTGPWAAIHRKHHAKCETSEDPHSPQVRGVGKVLFGGAELYRAEVRNEETLRRFGHGAPNDWMERNLYSKYPDLGISLLIVIDVALFGVLGVTVWAVQMVWIPFWAGGAVNGVGHFLGYRNFGCADASTNVIPLGILIGGEELHNNHHAYATSARLSSRWYEFDIGWMYIRILSALGLATIRHVARTPRLVKGRMVLDDSTLQAVLAHRHEVMARYARTAEQAYRQELTRMTLISTSEKSRLLREARSRFRTVYLSQEYGDPAWTADIGIRNRKLDIYVQLHAELAAMWERSNRSREQLLRQLQEWCHRAEHSDSRALEEFSLRLRQYA
ncbi:fatty acid desaturase [Burkholderia sp. 9120]|uniref:DesA family fatty acid desaturase n=1 Tax=Burkholderia sp. 9120 TaxID=1500897 RepID=UPI000552117C|nr:fatty acid desaturase [Burkholderia sp. 9120]